MTAATATFLEISNALAEMQSQQQLPYSGFTHAKDKSSASEQSLNARNAKDVSDAYEKARTALSEHINVLARKARSISIGRAISAAMRPQSATSMTTR